MSFHVKFITIYGNEFIPFLQIVFLYLLECCCFFFKNYGLESLIIDCEVKRTGDDV